MECINCNTYNEEHHIYCYYCGTKLESNKEKIDSVESASHEYRQNTLDTTSNNAQPLRRQSRKSRRKEDRSLTILIRVCSAIIIISILSFIGLIVHDKFIKGRPTSKSDDEVAITANYAAEQDTIDGMPVHRIIIETDDGAGVKILDRTAKVEDGRAEIIIDDNTLMTMSNESSAEGELKVTLDVIISTASGQERKDKISFKIASRAAPLSMVHPKTDEYFTEEDTLTILMEVIPDSKVLINGDNFSDLVTEEGKFEKTFPLTDDMVQKFEIVISANGFDDNRHTIKVRRGDGGDTNSIIRLDEKQPLSTSGEWIKISGTTEPDAQLEVIGVEIKPDYRIEPDGKFAIYARPEGIGYTLCTLTANTEDGQNDSLDIVLEKPTTEFEYTRKAWEFIYDDMVQDPSLYNGQIFLLTGEVTDILSLDGKYAFVLDMAPEDDLQQLVYVEYWGNIKLERGQKLRIFGNRWGNKDGIPMILARFMYRN